MGPKLRRRVAGVVAAAVLAVPAAATVAGGWPDAVTGGPGFASALIDQIDNLWAP